MLQAGSGGDRMLLAPIVVVIFHTIYALDIMFRTTVSRTGLFAHRRARYASNADSYVPPTRCTLSVAASMLARPTRTTIINQALRGSGNQSR